MTQFHVLREEPILDMAPNAQAAENCFAWELKDWEGIQIYIFLS